MGRIRNALRTAFRALRISRPEKPDSSSFSWFPRTNAGIAVDHDTALTYAAVWACVQVICGSVSQMGWHVYRPVAGGRKRVSSSPAEWLLDIQANPETNAFNFREALLRYALLWGNGYAEIERDLAGRAMWMWIISPDRVCVDRDSNGQLVYDVRNQGRANTVVPAEDMFHLKGLGNGITGLSVVSYARQSMGLGLATEKFGSTFFGNGARPGVVLEHPGLLTEPAQERLRESFMKKNSGDKALGVEVLEEGMSLKTFSIAPNDAQFLETRVHQVLEICRWFNVKPHKIAELSRATFSNIEESNIDHVVDTCLPWVIRLEQEANVKLFGANRGALYTKLNVASLLRGKLADRYQAYATGRQWGWLSPNDVRAWEDLNPLPPHIGDLYLTPTNMMAMSLDPDAPIIGVPAQAPQSQRMPLPEQPSSDQPQDLEERLRMILAQQVAKKETTLNGATHP